MVCNIKRTRKRIIEDPTCTKFLENKNIKTTSSVSTKKYNKNNLISQIITSVKNSSCHESGLAVGIIWFLNNGISIQVSAANIIINELDELSVVTYDHLGNRVLRYWLVELVPDVNEKRTVFIINKSNCWVINRVHQNENKVIWRASANEMDNHSDNHCFGKNYWPI